MDNNIYDMSKTAMIGNKFYEKLGKDKFRMTLKVCEGGVIVTDKALIKRLNKIFGPEVVIED